MPSVSGATDVAVFDEAQGGRGSAASACCAGRLEGRFDVLDVQRVALDGHARNIDPHSIYPRVIPVAALPQPLRGSADPRPLLRDEASETARPRAGTACSHFHNEDRAPFACKDVDFEPTHADVRPDDARTGSH